MAQQETNGWLSEQTLRHVLNIIQQETGVDLFLSQAELRDILSSRLNKNMVCSTAVSQKKEFERDGSDLSRGQAQQANGCRYRPVNTTCTPNF